jgi:hypothetical protein
LGPTIQAGTGVVGFGGEGDGAKPGVFGASRAADGIVGVSEAANKSGVVGFSASNADTAFGVFGTSQNGIGVGGFTASGMGLLARSDTGTAIFAASAGTNETLSVVNNHPDGGPAAFFLGHVVVAGNHTVVGTKSAAIPQKDGTHRLLYSMESPESWFEDFGEATLKHGNAVVSISADFLACIRKGTYHVFVTPLGDCQGLYIKRRSGNAFEVRELNGGRGEVRFSYRLVAKRKDIQANRFEKVKINALANSAKDLERRLRIQIPETPKQLMKEVTMRASEHISQASAPAGTKGKKKQLPKRPQGRSPRS